ncbi:hypothetical protein [Alicyclobacillus cycloheptanicus]|uniref:hypothetical protein n=1 Tax=Alicyclobacillus cycloheptanicus TaxID=1457 RepID=UPI0027D820CF|nr:hypothetical protein [Alicyclobacillus cycloheptanicus]
MGFGFDAAGAEVAAVGWFGGAAALAVAAEAGGDARGWALPQPAMSHADAIVQTSTRTKRIGHLRLSRELLHHHPIHHMTDLVVVRTGERN